MMLSLPVISAQQARGSQDDTQPAAECLAAGAAVRSIRSISRYGLPAIAQVPCCAIRPIASDRSRHVRAVEAAAVSRHYRLICRAVQPTGVQENRDNAHQVAAVASTPPCGVWLTMKIVITIYAIATCNEKLNTQIANMIALINHLAVVEEAGEAVSQFPSPDVPGLGPSRA